MLAVAGPAVRLAGVQNGRVHCVGATRDEAFILTTAMFDAETLAVSVGGAARHGARLPLRWTAAVCVAMLEPWTSRGAASNNLAPPMRTMPSATTTGTSKSLATLNVAHFCLATAMPATQSSCCSIRFAIVKRAEAVGAMLLTQAVFDST